jgi:iron complex transport system substrate-binding protein
MCAVESDSFATMRCVIRNSFAALIAALAMLPLATLARADERIVSLVPAVTETLFALGAGDEVVGVSSYDDYPPEAARLPKVGSFLTPNIEAIVALRPTLIIGRGISSNQREIRALNSMGYETLMVDDDSLAQIEQSIVEIGARVGKHDAADNIVKGIENIVREVREKLREQPVTRVLMLVGHQPIVAVGPGTYLDDLLKIAGGENIADASAQQWPRLSIEYIIATRPEVILDGQMGTDPSAPNRFWQAWPSIPAVKNHRVVGYPDDPTLHPGPRVGATIEMIARLIHPDAWAASTK